jgi:hypothetical protein
MGLVVEIDVPVLLGVLAFAGVLIGVLAGARGQKILDARRNHRAHNSTGMAPEILDAMRKREEFIDRLLTQNERNTGTLQEMGHTLRDLVIEKREDHKETATALTEANVALKFLVARADK